MKAFENDAVAAAFKSYPVSIRAKLLSLRSLIYEMAACTDGVGILEESLRWGEPAYLTTQSKSGTTLRIAWKKKHPSQYGMYFHCQTNLVDTFRTLFTNEFKFEGNRGIIFEESDIVPEDALQFCIVAALTYHRDKRGRSNS